MEKGGLRPRREVLRIVKDFFDLECAEMVNIRDEASLNLLDNLIKTADGSYTIESDSKGEAMHTTRGAITESLEKFVKPAVTPEMEDVKVLDVCSGLGYNTAALLEFTDALDVTVDMVEISMETIAAGLLVPSPLPAHELVKVAYEDFLISTGFACLKLKGELPDNIKLRVHNDDARRVVRGLQDDFYDAVFLDAFSPSRAPELYTVEFLSHIGRILKQDGVITTYTSAAPFRGALIEAGFHIGEGPVFGRKSGGTVASKDPKRIERPIRLEDERMVALSDAGIPFRDPDLSLETAEIIKRRQKERGSSRGISRLSSAVKTPQYLGRNIPMDRIGRRVLRNLQDIGITSTRSREALYIICPQMAQCVCGCGCDPPDNSRDRIVEMQRRLLKVACERVNKTWGR